MKIVNPSYQLEDLRDRLGYDPMTGIFTDAKGRRIGTVGKDGYRRIGFQRKVKLAHRMAWFYHYGSWPDGEVDHINENKDDNRIENLRVVNRSENMHNVSRPRKDSLTGVRGIAKRGNKWRPHVSGASGMRYLGSFENLEDAIRIREQALRSGL